MLSKFSSLKTFDQFHPYRRLPFHGQELKLFTVKPCQNKLVRLILTSAAKAPISPSCLRVRLEHSRDEPSSVMHLTGGTLTSNIRLG
jgi:hypothetical protein